MHNSNDKRQYSKGQRGFVLVTMALTAIVVFGCLGLSVDVGKLYIVKNEAQSYADAAALAGALKLDGTAAGVTAAQSAATGLADKWNFMTTSFSGTTVEVSTTANGPWTNASSPPSPATDYSYVRVTATAPVSVYFVPVVTGGALSNTVNASAVAGQTIETTSNEGLFPFSPIAFDGPTGGGNAASPWGFVPGQQYTMRYGSNGKTECTGDDADTNHLKVGGSVGFWGDSSASTDAGQVTGDLQEESLTIGQVLPAVGGAKTSVDTAIVDRVNQDGDKTDNVYGTATTPGTYLANPLHNGRRVVSMPVQSEVDGTVLGFGSFLLLDNGSYGHSGQALWCAVFIGDSKVIDAAGPGASSTPGTYQVKLVK